MEVAEVEAFRKSKQDIQLDHQGGKRETLHQSNQEEDILGLTSQPSSHEEESLEVASKQPQSPTGCLVMNATQVFTYCIG